MKVLPAMLCSSLLTVLFVVSPVAHADQQLAASMCDYIKADDKNRFRKLLSDNRLRLRNIYDGIMCDGHPLVRFAVVSNASGAGEFIIKQLPGNQVAQSGDLEWATSNGFAASPILEAIKARSAS